MPMRTDSTTVIGRSAVVITVMLFIALIHVFRVGTYLEDPLFSLYYSYFSDIIIPFGMYFLLCLNDVTLPFLKDWWVKALIVFTVAAITEIMQAFGIPLLGQTFDMLDIVMFAVGVLSAAFVDRIIFDRIFPFWSLEKTTPSSF